MILGDLNARVGGNNKDRERVMGKHGFGTINDNEERLYDFCQENDLIFGGTLFQRNDIHKITWTSPDGNTKSQMDHILINGKWRSSLQDVKACRGADIARDHNLLVGHVTLKLRKAKRGQEKGRLIDSARLKDAGTKQVFKQELKNRVQVLGEKQEMNTDTFNQAFREAGEKVLGYKKKKKEEWTQTRTWQKIAERVKDQLKRSYTKQKEK